MFALMTRSWMFDALDRITVGPTVSGGKGRIRGLTVTVGMIVGQVGSG